MAATDRVGIEVEVLGYEAAHRRMQELEQQLKGLGGKKARIDIEARVDKLKKNLQSLRSEKVKVQLDTTKADKDIRKLQQRIQRLQRSKVRFNMSESGIAKVDGRIRELQNRVNVLKGNRLTLQSDLGRVNQEIRETTSELQRLQQALRNVKSMSLGQVFGKISSSVSHIGQAMQSAGNALTRIGSPISRLMRGTVFAGGFAAFGKISEGISSGFSRYDTMKKYPKMMEEYNTASYNASQSIEALEKSVRGLPTGLDEIVDIAQRYTLSLGDMERGTNLAIASNNAFLASMATDTQKYQGMMQLQDLMNGKDLNSREWMSLGASMGKAINEIGKEFGYTNDNMGEFRKALYAGEIESKDFLDALEKVGTGSGKVAQLAENSKDTWEAFTQNVGNAFSRMTAGVIESFDEIVKIATGGKFDSVNKFLSDKVIVKIDAMAESAKKWIKAHPEKIMNFFDALKKVDWKSLGKGFVEGVGGIVSLIQKGAGLFKGKSLAWIGKMLPYFAPLGTVLTVFGGILKGSRHIIAGGVTGLFGFVRGLGRLLHGIGGALGAGAIANIGAKIQTFIDKLKDFGKVKAATEAAEGAAKGAAKSAGNIKSYFAKMGKALGGLFAVELGATSITATAWANVKMIKDMLGDLGEIGSLARKIDVGGLKQAGKVVGAIEGPVAAIGGAVGALTAAGVVSPEALGLFELGVLAVGTVITTITGAAWLNTKIIEGTLENFLGATEAVKKIGENINKISAMHVDVSGVDDVVEAIGKVSQLFQPEGQQQYLGHGQVKKGNDNGLITKKEAKSAEELFKSIKNTITSLKNAATDLKALEELELDVETAKTNAEKVIGGLKEVLDTLKTDFNVKGKKDIKASGNAKTIVDNISEILTTIRNSVEDIKALASEEIDFWGAKSAIHGIGKQMGELYVELENAFMTPIRSQQIANPSNRNGLTTIETGGDVRNAFKTSPQLSNIMTNLSSAMSQLKRMYDIITNKDTGLANVDTNVFAEQAATARTLIASVAYMWEGIKESLKKLQDTEDQAEKIENITNMMEALPDLITQLSTLSEQISTASGGKEGAGAYDMSLGFGGVGGVLGQIPRVIDQIREINFALEGIEVVDNSAKIESLRTTLQKLRLLYSDMSNFSGQQGGQGFSGIGGAFAVGMGNASMFAGLDTMLNDVKSMILKLNQINATLATVNPTDATAKIEQIRTMLRQIKSLLTEAQGMSGAGNNLGSVLDGVAEGVRQLGAQVKAIAKSFSNDIISGFNFGAIRAKVVAGIAGVAQSMMAQRGRFRQVGVQLGRATVDGIRSQLRSVSVSVGIHAHAYLASLSGIGAILATVRSAANTTVNAGIGVAAAIRHQNGGVVHRANGGAIYRARGGISPFRKRGTDTVPAMLTPGEFVTKKKAVDYFGLEFMRKINDMDIAGAMRELSARAGRNSAISRGTVINNNTTNNNTANVNQTIYTSNPNFAFKRSGRALAAL